MLGPDDEAEGDLGNDPDDVLENNEPEVSEVKPEPAKPAAPVVPPASEEGEPNKSEKGAIPYVRFKEVIDDNKVLRDRLAAFEKAPAAAATDTPAAPAVPEKTLRELTRQKNDLLLEGKLDEAEEIEDQIRERILADSEKRAYERLTAEQKAQEQRNEQEIVVQIENRLRSEHPELDPRSSEYNDEKLHEISSWCGYYMQKGDKAADALKKAAERLYPKPGAAQQSTKPDAAKAAREAELEKTRSRIPPSMSGAGASLSKKSRERSEGLSEKEWNALSKEEQEEELGNA